jgi:hypothetical protein
MFGSIKLIAKYLTSLIWYTRQLLEHYNDLCRLQLSKDVVNEYWK